MAEDIRDLIEKINQDGIKAAEKNAQVIEARAKQKAEEIIASARLEAEKTIATAHERIHREDESERALLAQAGRDLLLSLRNEINAMLGRIIISDIRQILTPDALYHFISAMLGQCNEGETGNIEISLKKEDLEVLENHYFQELLKATKRNIILKPSDEISGGFIISYDNGRSWYDFSDKSLADYIVAHLKPKLNSIMEDSLKG